ncbi:MAG TPA: cellulase family glycosylhydrolase [Acidimicrobiales bacterium]|nr:cellulase family glycosylhydrolase [Acidimicrobiales bacterium]
MAKAPTTRRRALASLTAAAAAVGGTAVAAAAPGAHRAAAATAPVAVRVAGTGLVDGSGAPLVLRGVDRSGMEYACVQGWGMADGPMDQASVDAMAAWHVNAVRVPLNEDCWLGINGVPAAYSGANYQAAVQAYVSELHADGMVAILDLHWSAPGTQLATGQQVMADADHSPAFWSSVATAFKADPGVMFDLYNEPHGISWSCWADGCTTPGWQTAGMTQLLSAVRSTGATQPVLVAPLGWAGATGGPAEYGTDPNSGWLEWRPVDPAGQEVASLHLYSFSGCNTTACWDQQVAPVAAVVPVVTGEFGETDCATAFDTSLMGWDDAHGASYLAWAWNQSSDTCGDAGPSVVTDYAGDPTTSGAAVQSHYLATSSSPSTSTTTAAMATTTTTQQATTTTTASTTTTTVASKNNKHTKH